MKLQTEVYKTLLKKWNNANFSEKRKLKLKYDETFNEKHKNHN